MGYGSGRIVPPSIEDLPRKPDILTDQEDKRIDRERSKEETRKLKLKNRELKQNIRERKRYADRVYCLVSSCLVALFVLVLVQGWSEYTGFQITDKVFIALITSATANVIGLFIVVVKYLFPNVPDSK